jgi:hypothetical protein
MMNTSDSLIWSMTTLLEKLAAQLNSVRAKAVLCPEEIEAPRIKKPIHLPRNPGVDNSIHIGPKGGRYRISASGRKVYI